MTGSPPIRLGMAPSLAFAQLFLCLPSRPSDGDPALDRPARQTSVETHGQSSGDGWSGLRISKIQAPEQDAKSFPQNDDESDAQQVSSVSSDPRTLGAAPRTRVAPARSPSQIYLIAPKQGPPA